MKRPTECDMVLLTNYIAGTPEQTSHVPGRGDPEPNGTYRLHVSREQRDWIVDALRSYPPINRTAGCAIGPVAWVGMNPQQAADLASTLLKRAREAGRMNGQSIAFTIG